MPVRLSVRLSVRHTGGQSKTVELTVMQFSPYSSLGRLVFAGYVSSRNSDGSPPAAASNEGGLGKTSYFRASNAFAR